MKNLHLGTATSTLAVLCCLSAGPTNTFLASSFQPPNFVTNRVILDKSRSILRQPVKPTTTTTITIPTKMTWGERARLLPFASLFMSSASMVEGSTVEEDEDEWHPHDPAYTTPQLLSALWFMIAQAGTSLSRGESMTVMFPSMEEDLNNPAYLNRLLAHFDLCKDVCDDFGINTILRPYIAPKTSKIGGFTVKSYRNPDKKDNYEEFPYDPFWDDNFDHSTADAEAEGLSPDALAKKENSNRYGSDAIPSDDDEIIKVTKIWVNKLMSDMGICPFSSGPDLAGLPVGPVFYTVDRASKMEDIYARYWKEVVRVEQNKEKDLSTTLLIAPEFCFNNAELFETFTTTLTQPLEALGVEDLLQLVFFHPEWTFRDGGDRSGAGAAANYARRSPWPMINILRTKQVRAAQKGIPTGLVYQQNEKTLGMVGADLLEDMLRKRNWDEVADVKVNRKDREALRVAQDLQTVGQVQEKDKSMAYDSTPAAMKVNTEAQTKGANMVKVVLQALEKRLGKDDSSDGGVKPLTGAETSAAMMASDFLLKELDAMVVGLTEDSSEGLSSLLAPETPDPDREDAEQAVLWGGGGIPMSNDPDEEPGRGIQGVNPQGLGPSRNFF